MLLHASGWRYGGVAGKAGWGSWPARGNCCKEGPAIRQRVAQACRAWGSLIESRTDRCRTSNRPPVPSRRILVGSLAGRTTSVIQVEPSQRGRCRLKADVTGGRHIDRRPGRHRQFVRKKCGKERNGLHPSEKAEGGQDRGTSLANGRPKDPHLRRAHRHTGLFARAIGIARARTKIGMANLAFNLTRFVWRQGRTASA